MGYCDLLHYGDLLRYGFLVSHDDTLEMTNGEEGVPTCKSGEMLALVRFLRRNDLYFLRSLELLVFVNEGSSLRSAGLMGSLVLGLEFEEQVVRERRSIKTCPLASRESQGFPLFLCFSLH